MSNSHNRKLKLIELREQTANTIRSEKRGVYLELRRTNRLTVQHAVQMGYMGLEQQLRVDLSYIDEASERFRRLIPELELVSSREVYDLSHALFEAHATCINVMYRENEKRFAQYDREGKDPSSEQATAIWEEVSAEVQKVYEQSRMEEVYGQARNQIREELGFLSLDPALIPTEEETEKLRSELSKLDQMK